MTTRAIARVAACAAALITAAPAAAAGQWSAAADLGGARYVPVELGFTTGGDGVLALAPRGGAGGPVLQATISRSGGLGPLSALTRPDDMLEFEKAGRGRQLAVFGRNRVVATGARGGRPWVAFGRIGQRLGRRRPLAVPGWSGGSLALAANARGDVAVISIGCGGCARTPLYVFYRPHGGRFGRAERVSGVAYEREEFGGVAPAVAVNAAGRVLVAWGRRSLGRGAPWPLYARIRHGRRWRGPSQRLGVLHEYGAITARLANDDRAVVAWWTQHADAGGAGSGPLAPPTYHASTAGTSGRFGPARQLDAGVRGSDLAPGWPSFFPVTPNLHAAIAPSGRARIAWTSADADGAVVRVATIADNTLTAVQTLGCGTLAALGTDGHDTAVALWASATELHASLAEVGQPYAVPEQVEAGPPVVPGIAEVAVDPGTRRIAALWSTADPSSPGWVDAWRPRYAIREPLSPPERTGRSTATRAAR